jgi:neutral ceramidase
MLRPGRPVAGPTTTHYREVSLPLDVTPTPDNLRHVLACYIERSNNAALPGYYRRHARQMISQIEAGTVATSIPVPVQSWRFTGSPDLRLLLAGGEIVSGYAAYFRARYGTSSRLLFAGYANEVPAYLPSDELLRRASTYAGGIDSDFPGIAGGSMTVYGWMGHLRGKPTADSPDGVEQILIRAIDAALTA